MNRSIIRTIITITAVTAAFVISSPAQAHEITPGGKCPLSGAVHIEQGKTYVCTTNASGKPVWGKGLKKSVSKLTVVDTWAKAADSGMTAAFGKVTNPGSKSVNIVAASSPVAGVVQLHEVVDKDGKMVMQQKPGGFTIAPGAALELKPGGNHLMFMGLKKPVKAGQLVPVTIILSDGSRQTITAMAKVFNGGNENYDANAGSMSMS